MCAAMRRRMSVFSRRPISLLMPGKSTSARSVSHWCSSTRDAWAYRSARSRGSSWLRFRMAIIVRSSGLPASMAMDLDSRIAFCKRSRFGAACAGSSKVTSCQRSTKSVI